MQPKRLDAGSALCRPASSRRTARGWITTAFALPTTFRAAFPDLNFWGTADLLAEGDYVVGQWEGGGTQTGTAFDDMPVGALPARTGKSMRFTRIAVLEVENGLITEEVGLDDGVTVLQQLGLIRAA
ncbi:ester cyclase [Pseudonocardia sp. T1-2H]|uniref:ester cyclase n=1 Tax=Pseudonocardia sp. T1-2H TaxID=3128899 RepID=UPI003100D19B